MPGPASAPASRVVSLLPSATEILCALGMRDQIVGVTHECDYPPGIADLPHVTKSLLPPGLTCREIDTAVSEALKADAHTIYALDESLLRELNPDAIVTQALCDVCAVPEDNVRQFTACSLPSTTVVTADPSTLEELFQVMRSVGHAVGAPDAESTLEALKERLIRVHDSVQHVDRLRVAILEWPDPLYSPGHWVPDQVDAAGGIAAVGESGAKSQRITWDELFDASADVVVAAFCGCNLKQNQERVEEIANTPEWKTLVQLTDVYASDASSYFSRPGPRLVEGVELLAFIMHPDMVEDFYTPQRGQLAKLVDGEWIDIVDLDVNE